MRRSRRRRIRRRRRRGGVTINREALDTTEASCAATCGTHPVQRTLNAPQKNSPGMKDSQLIRYIGLSIPLERTHPVQRAQRQAPPSEHRCPSRSKPPVGEQNGRIHKRTQAKNEVTAKTSHKRLVHSLTPSPARSLTHSSTHSLPSHPSLPPSEPFPLPSYPPLPFPLFRQHHSPVPTHKTLPHLSDFWCSVHGCLQ